MKKAVSILLAAVMMAVMGVSAMAAEFVSSIEAKTAPETVDYIIDGKEYSMVFVDPVTKEIAGGIEISEDGVITFRLVSAAENIASGNKIKDLSEAMSKIQNAPSLKLLSGSVSMALDEIIRQFNEQNNQNLTAEDVIITDLFKAFLEGDGEVPEGVKYRFQMKPSFDKDDCATILFQTPENEWIVVEDIRWTEDGYLEVTTDELGIFALGTDKTAALPVDPDGPDSPRTGDEGNVVFLYAGIAVLCLGFAAFFFVRARRKTA